MQKEDFNEIINLLKQYGPEYVYNLITTNNTNYPSIQNIQQFTGGASQAISMIKDIHQDYIDFKEGGFLTSRKVSCDKLTEKKCNKTKSCELITLPSGLKCVNKKYINSFDEISKNNDKCQEKDNCNEDGCIIKNGQCIHEDYQYFIGKKSEEINNLLSEFNHQQKEIDDINDKSLSARFAHALYLIEKSSDKLKHNVNKKTSKRYKLTGSGKKSKSSSPRRKSKSSSQYSPIKKEYKTLNKPPFNELSRSNFILLTKNMKLDKKNPYVKMYYLDIKKIAKELSKIQKGGDNSGDSILITNPEETFEPLPENLQEGGFFSFYLNKYTVTLDRLEKYSKDIQDWKWFEMNIKFLAGKTDTVKTKEKQEGGNNEYSEYEQYGGKIQMSDYSSDGNPNIDSNFLTSYTLSNYSSNSSPSLELTLSSNDDLLVSEL